MNFKLLVAHKSLVVSLENQIDQLVYVAYNLGDDGITLKKNNNIEDYYF